MDLSAAYLAAEELISSIPTNNESGRIKAITIYNAASYLLDDAVSAWYKRVATADRFPAPSRDEAGARIGRIPWEQQFALLTRVPWIVPIYTHVSQRRASADTSSADTSSSGETSNFFDVPIRRKVHLRGTPTYLLKEGGWRGGVPYPGLRCVGLAMSPISLSHDEPRLDFTAPSTMRDVYSNARSSLIESGATHTRNIPYAGIIHASNIMLCPIGMNRLGSEWCLNVQGAFYHSTPISRWADPYTDWFEALKDFAPHISRPIVLAMWDRPRSEVPAFGMELEAQMAIESVFYQIATMRDWNYLHESIDLRSDPLPRNFPVSSQPAEYKSLAKILPLVVHSPTKGRAIVRLNGEIGFILHSLYKVMKSRKVSLPRRVRGVMKALRILFSDADSSRDASPSRGASPSRESAASTRSKREAAKVGGEVMSKVVSDLRSIKSTTLYNPSRIKKLRQMVETIKILASLVERKKVLDRLRAELTFHDHFYNDKETGVRAFCEHEIEVLHNLTRGVMDIDEIVQKFSSSARAQGSYDMSIAMPNVLECKYCGQDLGTIWLVNVSSPEEIEYAQQIEGTFLDTEIGGFIAKLYASQSIQTKAMPSEVTRIVDAISNIPLGIEYLKMQKANVRDRYSKEKFLALAATVSLLNALQQSGAPIVFDMSSLDALLAKEYIDLLQKVGLLPKDAIKRMLEYWPKTLSRHLPNPSAIIRNAVIELSGVEGDTVLGRFYTSAVAYPVTMKVGQTIADPNTDPRPERIKADKLRSASTKTYMDEMRRTTPIDPRSEHARVDLRAGLGAKTDPHTRSAMALYRVPMLSTWRNDPRIYFPKGVQKVSRTSEIGEVHIEDREAAFSQTIMSVCPELLLHPMEGKKFYELIAASGRMSSIFALAPATSAPATSAPATSVPETETKTETAPVSEPASALMLVPSAQVSEEAHFGGARTTMHAASRVTPLTGIHAAKVSLEAHVFSRPSWSADPRSEHARVSGSDNAREKDTRRKCLLCGIASDLVYDTAYYNKYHAVVEALEKGTSTSETKAEPFECIAPTARADPRSEKSGEMKLDALPDKNLTQVFARKFGWSIGPDTSIVPELISIVSSIGHYRLSRILSDEWAEAASLQEEKYVRKVSSALASLINTAWNVFMTWILKQREELATRTLNRLRAIRALHARATVPGTRGSSK